MSPRYVAYYKKNREPIATINHETLDFRGSEKEKITLKCWK